jgi:hypothetical protein
MGDMGVMGRMGLGCVEFHATAALRHFLGTPISPDESSGTNFAPASAQVMQSYPGSMPKVLTGASLQGGR